MLKIWDSQTGKSALFYEIDMVFRYIDNYLKSKGIEYKKIIFETLDENNYLVDYGSDEHYFYLKKGV